MQDPTTNRRTFIKGAALSGIAFQFSPPTGRNGKPSEDYKVKYVKYLIGNPPNRKKVYGEVSQDHWAKRFTAYDLKDQMLRKIRSKWGDDSGVTAEWGVMPESPSGFGVRVVSLHQKKNGRKDSPGPHFEEVRREIPNQGRGKYTQGDHAFERGNIPIKVVERTATPAHSESSGRTQRQLGSNWCPIDCQQNQTQNYSNNIPAGIPIQDPERGTGGTKSSLAAPFNHDTHGEGWIGSGHGLRSGHDIYHADAGGIKIGTCKEYNDDFLNDIEWAYIAANSSPSPYKWVSDEQAKGGYHTPIVGIVKDQELINDVGTSTEYIASSMYQCHSTGKLKGTGGVVGTSWVHYEHDLIDGDSGGLLFKEDSNGNALIAAKHTEHYGSDDDCDDAKDDARGTTAETVENEAGGHFISY